MKTWKLTRVLALELRLGHASEAITSLYDPELENEFNSQLRVSELSSGHYR